MCRAWGSTRPFEVVIAKEKRCPWLFSRSTFRTAHSGNVKPLPDGPAPCVWPVKELDVVVLAVGKKLEAWVEKHKNFSLRCSLPT